MSIGYWDHPRRRDGYKRAKQIERINNDFKKIKEIYAIIIKIEKSGDIFKSDPIVESVLDRLINLDHQILSSLEAMLHTLQNERGDADG